MFRRPRSLDLSGLRDVLLAAAAAAYTLGFVVAVEVALGKLSC